MEQGPGVEGVRASGWKFSGGKLRQKRGREWTERLSFDVFPHGVLVDEDGIVRAFDVEFVGAGPRPIRLLVHERFLGASSRPDSLIQMGGPAMLPEEAKAVAELLAAVRGAPRSVADVITRAEWAGDEMRVPGLRQVAPQRGELEVYGDLRGDEDDARRSWTEIVELSRRAGPKSMAVLGMPVGSLYVTKLDDPQLFTMHITGESHSGKSESAELAMQTMGDARKGVGRLYRNWNMSAKAPENVLRQVGIMPVWFDEAANDESDPEDFSTKLFHLMEGRARKIAGTDGKNVGGDEKWTACLLSTGEARLSINSGLSGFRRRVMELYAPLTDDVETHDRMMHLARRAHGWPLRWVAADAGPTEFVDVQRMLFARLADEAQGQQVEVAQAANVATCIAGFWKLAQAVGVSVPKRELVSAGLSVFRKLLRAAEDEGSDVGERGLRALKEATQTTNYFHAPQQDMFHERWGVTFDDGVIGVLGEATLRRILREYAGIGDSQPVLEKWSEQGILMHESGTYTSGTRSIWVPATRQMRRARMYLVKVGGE